MAINKTINKRTNSHGAMRNCIEYVLREGKTDQHLVHIIGPYPYEEVNYDLVYQSFLEEKRLWGKDSGRMYAHNVISWHKDEKITPEQALEFGIAFAEKWFSGFQTVVSVHKDKDHIHCHLVTNSVSYENGKKLHNSRKDLERMKQLTNQMCPGNGGLLLLEKENILMAARLRRGKSLHGVKINIICSGNRKRIALLQTVQWWF
ncbi:MAG: relaxase/mobilization nuclease domain-containing protein [Blautia sp.]|uniref:relaxase/mobilization nuclease domain-containing protein n=1 Tax=Blautia sp. TaxID=1955243 RepID=UPI002A800651|nr:relaxase/mobilization nuclease domain-containing protein [Blautia sp.]MDY4116085.1 relaxase/mobilization nuclease domain-containing protein [Blautia sp.]